MSVLTWWPRRAPGLPPGQRLLTTMPRFADDPTRWVPAVPDEPTVALGTNGDSIAIDVNDLATRATQIEADFHCVTTWSVRGVRWSGVMLGDLVQEHLGDEVPPYALVTGGDGAAARFLTDDLLGDDVMLATHLDGQPLPLRHGAPVRLVTPRQYGYKNVKHVVQIDFRDELPDGVYGAKEHLRGRVALEERHQHKPNWLLRPIYRWSIAPTAIIADRTLTKHPDGRVSGT